MKKEQVYRSFAVFNFKKFGSTVDASVDFAPITFLTGANGSGKSSFVKSFVLCDKLLNDWKTQYNAKKDIILKDTVLDFTDKRLNLGSYQYVRNEKLSDKLTCFTYRDSAVFDHELQLWIEAFDDDSQGRIVKCILNNDLFSWYDSLELQWDVYENRFSFEIAGLYGLLVLERLHKELAKRGLFVKTMLDNGKGYISITLGGISREEVDDEIKDWIAALPFSYGVLEDCEEDDPDSVKIGISRRPDPILTLPVIKEFGQCDCATFRSGISARVEGKLSEDQKSALEGFMDEFEQSGCESLEVFAVHWAYDNLFRGEIDFDEESKMMDTAQRCLVGYLHLDRYYLALDACSRIIDSSYDGQEFFLLSKTYFEFVIKALTPAFAGNVIYHESVHNVSRSYNHNQGDENFYHIVKQYLDRSQAVYRNEEITYSPGSFTNKWVDKFGIGEGVSVDKDGNTNSISISVRKSILDTRPLADEGLGVNCIVMMLLEIENAIMASLLDGQDKTIILEEPESHLHPRWQSMVTDVMLDAYDSYDVRFIVETHSEYMIRRSQVLARGLKPMPFDAFYFPGDAEAYSLQYQEDGHFGEKFGPGFYDETTNLIEGLL